MTKPVPGLAWLRQTSTILGIATLAGIAAALINHQVSWAEAIPGSVAALIAMAIPGHPDLQATATKAAADAVAAVRAKGLGGSTAVLGMDLVTLAGSLPDNTPVVAVLHTVTPIPPPVGVPVVPTPIPAVA